MASGSVPDPGSLSPLMERVCWLFASATRTGRPRSNFAIRWACRRYLFNCHQGHKGCRRPALQLALRRILGSSSCRKSSVDSGLNRRGANCFLGCLRILAIAVPEQANLTQLHLQLSRNCIHFVGAPPRRNLDIRHRL